MIDAERRVSLTAEDWPRLLTKIDEAMKQDFDFTEQVGAP